MNGLAQITIDGQPVVLKFGLPALRRILDKMKTVDMITGNQYNELGITHILYAGYCNACEMKDIPVVLPFERFYDYVDDFDTEGVKEEIAFAIRAFEASKYVSGGGEKKKATETASPSIGME